MRETNHLYKKILNTAPFGTLFFAYGVCIDANQKALSILGCDRSELVGLSLNEGGDEPPPVLVQLKKVISKLEDEQLEGLLWRSHQSLDSTELVVSLGTVENADNVLSLMLYPLPALAKMVVEEFATDNLPGLDTTPAKNAGYSPERVNSPELTDSPCSVYSTISALRTVTQSLA